MPVNVSQGDLPELTIYLQQRVAGSDEWPSLKFSVDENGKWSFSDGTEAIAWTSDLEQVATNEYSYTLVHAGENTTETTGEDTTLPEGSELLPRYTEDGDLYEYRAIEVPWGLLDQPGGPTEEFVESTDFSELRTQNGAQIGVVVIEHGETGSFLIHNRYDSQKGNLTVKKHFTGRDANDLYPDTTFDVYRYYVNEKGEASEPALVASKTLTNNDLQTPTTGDDANPKVTQNGDNTANNTAEYTFNDLEIYAPDGSYWQYYVVERSINGYTTTVTVGNVGPNDAALGEGTQREDVTGTSSADLCATADDKVTGTVLGTVNQDGSVTTDTTPDVTFQNTYVPGTVDLTGTKTWDDYSDIFGVRPTVDEFKAGLTVSQIGNGATTDITGDLQGDDAEGANYYVISAGQNSSVYRIDIKNVEEWAPNGTRWQYQITENLSGMTLGQSQTTADNFYEPVGNTSSTVSAGAGTQFRLRNSLDGQATVAKSWVDGEDPYGLRPDSVTVALQARTKTADGTTSNWDYAYTVLANLAGKENDLASVSLGEDTFAKELNDNNGWKSSWTELPVAARQADGTIVNIEYRVVETKIGNQTVASPDDSGKYDEVYPYQPTQENWTGNAESGWATSISNTLDSTKISATKTWENDSLNGIADAWGTRPVNGNNWEVTYLLQQQVGDGEWHWLMQYGYDQAATDNPLAEGIVSQTISSTDATGATVTWDNLPECDENGKPYSYRVVEQVPGSYDLKDGIEVTTATDTDGMTYRFYVVSSTEGGDAGDSQSFTNVLRTTNLTGTKQWDDYDTGLANNLTADDMPQMTLYRATATIGADGTTSFDNVEQVKLKNSQAAPQPTWNDDDGDGVWTFTYENLPAANEDNVDYVYWAEEQLTTAEGYYPLYGSDNNQNAGGHDAAGTTVEKPATATESGSQTNEKITNVATRFTLNKVSDFTPEGQTEPEDLRDIELTVYGTGNASNIVYAVWKDEGGKATSTVRPEGTTSPATGGIEMTDDNAGFIVGLPAGTYTVKETGTVPAGYAKAPDVTVTIANNGMITAQNGVKVDITGSNPGGTIEINVEDPVLRGHLKLTKYVTDNGQVGGANQAALAGAVFDLYQVNPNGEDLLVASDLKTDGSGVITTVNNSTAVSDDFKTKYGNKYTKLSEGLPEGEYYFLETDATTGAVMPSGDAAKSPTMTITQDTHYDFTGKTVDAQMANEDFSAIVTLKKFDTETDNGIDNVSFQLAFTPEEGSASQWGTSRTYTTDSNGVLTLSGLEKGTYTLTERPNQGYENNGFAATFVIDEADDDQTYNITTTDASDSAVSAIGFKLTGGSFENNKGIPNKPQHGSVTMLKTDANGTALNGATFCLERMNGSDWTTTAPTVVAEGLVSDRTYQMTDDNTALVNADGTEITATDGLITVTNLKWGTYRFVETSPADGYVGVNKDGSAITSGNFIISRTQLNPTLATSAGAVRNEPTSLEINKASDAGQPLQGAQFQITAKDNSAFAQPSKFASGTYDDATKTVTLTTDSTGHIELNGQLVVGGTYTIYESKAPSGYDPADGILTVTVKDNGSLEVQGNMPDRYAWADLDEDGQADNAYSFMVKNIHEEIDIMKVNPKGNALQGAEFTLTGPCMDKNTSHTYITDEDGYIHVDAGLMGGVRYELKETKPADGYAQLGESLYFMMDERGEIVVTDAQENPLDEADYPTGFSVNDNRISLTVEDDPIELQITKRAPNNEDGTLGETLPWAEFTITPVNGSKFAAGANPTEAQTMRTGEDGTLSMSAYLIVGGTYDITETAAPEGYEKVEGTMRVYVEKDGTISVLGSVVNGSVADTLPPLGYSRVDGNKFEVQVVNEPIEIGIVKVDANNTTTQLPNAIFEITGEFAGSNKTETREFKTDENGTISINTELKSGQTYKLTEKQAPDGYEHRTGTLEFTVGENGEVSIVGAAPEGYSVEQGNVTIVASDEPIEIGFVKKDLGDTNLAGAEYTLLGIFVDDETHEKVELDIPFISTNDTISFAGLPYGESTYSLIAGKSYTLTENTAPAYYETLEPFTFSVDQDGKIAAAGGSEQAGEGEEGYVISETGGNILLTAHDTPIEVTLHKTSSANDQLALSGAIFELYQGESVEDEPYADVLVGEDGTVKIENLIAGTTYTLHEVTAPAGYELLPDVTFTVEKDGTVTLKDAPEGYTVAEGEDGIVTFTAADTPIEAQLVKTDEAGTPLANAIFTVQGTFAGDYANETEITLSATDANGVASIPSAALIANEKYTIAEVTAPGGYELAGSVEFMVGTDGVITIVADGTANADDATAAVTETAAAVDSSTADEGSATESAAVAGKNGTGTYTASTDGGTAVISATDHLVEVTITKTDGGQGLLPGAEFTATATGSNNGSAAGHSVTATTGEDGTAVLSGLIAGQEYALTETKAPAGYELLTDTLTFTVQADGTIDAGFFPPAAFTIGQAKDAVTVSDNPLEVTLVKQAPNGAPLAGAEFRVEGEFPDGQTEKTFTSDENGIVFHQLQLTGSAEGTLYTVTETKAPEGYAQPSGSLDLLVFEDGTVQVADTSAANMKQNASVTESSGVAVVTLNNEPLPGTELPQTGDNKILPLLAGAFGLLGLWAIVMGTVAYRRFRTKGEE